MSIRSTGYGQRGAQGPTGPKGDTGQSGPAGAVGPKGDTGPAGAKGDTGAVGSKGDAGASGAVGATGPQGVKGDTGATGPAGANASNLVGTVTLAESGLITLAVGVRKLTVPLAAAVTAGSYVAVPVAATPAGYSITGEVVCSTAGQITVSLFVPVLGVATSYSIPVKIHRLS